ncbi:hypothetical protein [Paenibacillus chitinolyticus]|uniref:hypothetical protein n=1 Tax=Paenibacillus chitinolyticus TaxID=79263 RepID=UPI00295EC060|nr:hypothetical protein [Paenibacillus chitinolyticus]
MSEYPDLFESWWAKDERAQSVEGINEPPGFQRDRLDQRTTGDPARDDRTWGNRPAAHRTSGNRTGGSRTLGHRTAGGRNDGNRNEGNRTLGNRTEGRRDDYGRQHPQNLPGGIWPSPWNAPADRPEGEFAREDRTGDRHTGGSRTRGNRTEGSRTKGNRTEWGRAGGNYSGGNRTDGRRTHGFPARLAAPVFTTKRTKKR